MLKQSAVVVVLALSALACREEGTPQEAMELAAKSVGYDLHACHSASITDRLDRRSRERFYLVEQTCRLRSQPELGEFAVYHQIHYVRPAGNSWFPTIERVDRDRLSIPEDWALAHATTEAARLKERYNYYLVAGACALLLVLLTLLVLRMRDKKPDYPQVARRVRIEYKPTKPAQSRNPHTLSSPHDHA